MRWSLLCLLLAVTPPGIAATSSLTLFVSAERKAEVSLARQKAREKLAGRELQREHALFARGAVSVEEYQTAETANTLARLDTRMGELKMKYASLSLALAKSLARTGRRIPLCQRRPQTDENTVSPLLRKPEPPFSPPIPPPPAPSDRRTRIDIGDSTPPPDSGGGNTAKPPADTGPQFPPNPGSSDPGLDGPDAPPGGGSPPSGTRITPGSGSQKPNGNGTPGGKKPNPAGTGSTGPGNRPSPGANPGTGKKPNPGAKPGTRRRPNPGANPRPKIE